jgi:hypothetical protein
MLFDSGLARLLCAGLPIAWAAGAVYVREAKGLSPLRPGMATFGAVVGLGALAAALAAFVALWLCSRAHRPPSGLSVPPIGDFILPVSIAAALGLASGVGLGFWLRAAFSAHRVLFYLPPTLALAGAAVVLVAVEAW